MPKKKTINHIINTKKVKYSDKKLLKILMTDNSIFDFEYKKRLSLSVESEIYDFLKSVSEDEGISVSAVVSSLLVLYAKSEGLDIDIGKTRKIRRKKKAD